MSTFEPRMETTALKIGAAVTVLAVEVLAAVVLLAITLG